jgi:hypothetical protein
LQADNQAAAAANLNATANNDRSARWRFRQHNGEWWYWTPQNTWMYHRSGNWSPYDQATYSYPQNFRRGYVQPGYSNRMYQGDGYWSGGRYYSGYGPRNYGYQQGYGYGNQYRYNSGYRGQYYGDPGYRAGVNVGGAIGGAVGGAEGAGIGAAIGGAIGAD